MSIRGKLILILSAVLLMAFVSTSIVTFVVSENRYRTTALDEVLPLLTNNILTEIQRDLMMPVDIASLMANDTFLRDWTLAGEQSVEQTSRYLNEIREAYGFFTAFFISDRTKRYYYYEGILKTISPEDAHDTWYYEFKDMGTPIDLDVDTDEATQGTLTVFINHRVLDYDGQFLGVAGVGLSMGGIGRLLSDYEQRYGRLVYLIDSDGIVQAHPDINLVETTSILDEAGISTAANDILSQTTESATYEFERGGRRVFLEVRRFPQFNWYLLGEQEEDQSFSSIRSTLLANLVVGLLATCIVVVIVVIVVNRFQGRLEALVSVDPLTGAFNRRYFTDIITQEASRAKRHGRPIGFLMIDVNDFKQINDELGHAVGDMVLQEVYTLLQSCVRGEDFVVRYGGDEFLVVLPETDGETDVVKTRIVEAMVRWNTDNSQVLSGILTLAIGVAHWAPESSQSLEEALATADRLMYEEKSAQTHG